MGTVLFTEADNGSLKFVAEIDSIDNPALAVDALLDENPRMRDTQFVAVTGSLDGGQVQRVVVESVEPVQPRRRISLSMNGGGAHVEIEAPKRRRGRPPGSGKAATTQTGDAPKRRGRPPGSKNKPKDGATVETTKRRGRPPGSKNKTTGTATTDAPKRRGRPPGSKNKPKATAGAASGTKPRRGRPPGSKNKPKAAGKASPFKTRPDDE